MRPSTSQGESQDKMSLTCNTTVYYVLVTIILTFKYSLEKFKTTIHSKGKEPCSAPAKFRSKKFSANSCPNAKDDRNPFINFSTPAFSS